MHFPGNVKYLWVLFIELLCFDAVLCENNCVCHLLGTLIQCKSTRHTVELCLRGEKTWQTLIFSNSTQMGILQVLLCFADYVNLFVKILKFTNVNVTNEYICIQLDTLGCFELIKNKLFLILMSNTFLKFLSNQHQRKPTRAFMLHQTAFCSIYAYR